MMTTSAHLGLDLHTFSPGRERSVSRFPAGEQLPAIWTVGHSTRTEGEFLDLLGEYRIEAVADVRRHPGSRRMPQFGSSALQASLTRRGVEYLWLPGLGGRRQPAVDSPNTAWRNASFRGYADYLHTELFAESFTNLLSLAHGLRTAIMCAEALWWRCHRSLIADVLKSLGYEVTHILGPGSSSPHPYTGAARLVEGQLTYS
jgi:uncharacterized protein (DUF488 family)